MTYTLRNYQTESVDAGVNFLLAIISKMEDYSNGLSPAAKST